MRLKATLRALMLTAVSFSLPLCVSADEMDAQTLLSTMSTSMRSLNYEGTFVHIKNGHADLLHVLHASDENGQSERMRSLNGEAREVIRNNQIVTCIWPGSGDVIINKSKSFSPLTPAKAELGSSSMYSVTNHGSDRVAGIETDVVNVKPVDELRYGYRFWVDKATGMMLRSMVLDINEQPVEEIMFTAIEYLKTVDPERFKPDVDIDRSQQVVAADGGEDSIKTVVNKVSFQTLPAGYEERSESLRMMSVRKDSPVSHVVVSDGVSTISVYVEYVARANHDPSALGSTSMGAINAFGLSLPDALVTAVGEAPRKTVEVIARAARLAQ